MRVDTDTLSLPPCSEFRPTILIAQANVEDLQLIKEASLDYNKYDVVTASTGQEVVDKVNSTCFDAIIIGLKFPDLTGATLAYLVHEFDPLIRIGFLSGYNSNILVAAVQELDCVFLDKGEEMQNLQYLCEKIYNIAMELPCEDKSRSLKREYSKDTRMRYKSYSKLRIPDSISDVVNRSQRWRTQTVQA